MDDLREHKYVFTVLNTISSTFLVGFVFYYSIKKYRWIQIVDITHTEIEFLDSLGALYSILLLFRKWQTLFGKLMIFFIHKCVHRKKDPGIELT